MKLPGTKILAALLIISFSLPAKPISDNQVVAIALTGALTTAASVGLLCYHCKEKSPEETAVISAMMAAILTGAAIPIILDPYTSKSKFNKLSRALNLLEIDHFLIKNFPAPEDFIQYVNESFDTRWPLVDGYNHLKKLQEQSSHLEVNLRKTFIELNTSSPSYHYSNGKYEIEKTLKIIDKIKVLISVLEKDNDFQRQKTLYIAAIKQKANIAAAANIKNVALKN